MRFLYKSEFSLIGSLREQKQHNMDKEEIYKAAKTGNLDKIKYALQMGLQQVWKVRKYYCIFN